MNDTMPELQGLVLAGGYSRRMKRDKASLVYSATGEPQWRITARLLQKVTGTVRISVRPRQLLEGHQPGDPELMPDQGNSDGPLTGILTALRSRPDKALLVVACDLPLLSGDILEALIAARGQSMAVAFQSSSDGLPEPLCAIYEPAMAGILGKYLLQNIRCPRKILIREESAVKLLQLPRAEALENANTPEDFERLSTVLASRKS